MTNIIDSVSLIPYLEAEASPFYLSLSAVRPTIFTDSAADSVFSVISDAAPFTRVIAAELKNDAAQSLQPLLIFSQKDLYPSNVDAPASFANAAIDNRWQELFSFYSENADAGLILLKRQIAENGGILPVSPLIYCQLKAVYFTLVCPYCGQPLTLCRDEQLLAEKTLKGYANTLKRYLYCQHCIHSGETADFYVPVKEPQDPVYVVDQANLIKNMGQSDAGPGKANSYLPCLDCDQRQACYGPDGYALSRISVFSFFPFYMFVFQADKISSPDYKKLVSGELFTQFKPGVAALDDSIAAVLKRILNRWRNEMTQPDSGIREMATHADLAATRIISGKTPERHKTPERKDSQDDQEMERTVIISKKQAATNPDDTQKTDDLEKTRIITRAAKSRSAPASGHPIANEPEVDFVGQSDAKEAAKALIKGDAKPRDGAKNTAESGTDLEKTVIIGRGKVKAKDK